MLIKLQKDTYVIINYKNDFFASEVDSNTDVLPGVQTYWVVKIVPNSVAATV